MGGGIGRNDCITICDTIKLFVIKLINDTMLKYKIITEAFSRLVSIVVSYEPEDE